jgi:hypothetical protein
MKFSPTVDAISGEKYSTIGEVIVFTGFWFPAF